MLQKISFTLLLMFLSASLAFAGPKYAAEIAPESSTVLVQEGDSELGERKERRINKKIEKLTKRIEHKLEKKGIDRAGKVVRIGLALIVVGLLLSLFGLAGGASGPLIQIGGVIVIVGIVFWIFGLLK